VRNGQKSGGRRRHGRQWHIARGAAAGARAAVAHGRRSRRLEADEVVSARGSGDGASGAGGVEEAGSSGGGDRRRRDRWPRRTAAGGGTSADGGAVALGGRQLEEMPRGWCVTEGGTGGGATCRPAAVREQGGDNTGDGRHTKADGGGAAARPGRRRSDGVMVCGGGTQ
jgi:hypothetical protein